MEYNPKKPYWLKGSCLPLSDKAIKYWEEYYQRTGPGLSEFKLPKMCKICELFMYALNGFKINIINITRGSWVKNEETEDYTLTNTIEYKVEYVGDE